MHSTPVFSRGKAKPKLMRGSGTRVHIYFCVGSSYLCTENCFAHSSTNAMSTTSTTTTTSSAPPPNTPYLVAHGPYQWRINNLMSYATEGPLLYGVVSNSSGSNGTNGTSYLVRKTAERLGSEPTNRAFDFVTIPSPLSNVAIIQQLGQTLFTATEGGHNSVYHLDWNYKRIRKLLVPESFGDFESLVFYGSSLHLFRQGQWLSLVYDLNRFKQTTREKKSPRALRNGIRHGIKINTNAEEGNNGTTERNTDQAVYDDSDSESGSNSDSDSDSDSEEQHLTISPITSPPKYGRQRARSSFGSFSESLSQSTLSDDISVCEHVTERSGPLTCHPDSLAQTCLSVFADPPSCIIGGEVGAEHGLVVDLVSGVVKSLAPLGAGSVL